MWQNGQSSLFQGDVHCFVAKPPESFSGRRPASRLFISFKEEFLTVYHIRQFLLWSIQLLFEKLLHLSYSELGLTIYQRKKEQRTLYTQYEQVARVLCSRIPMFPERISLLTHIFSTQFILQQVTYITFCSNPGVRRRISISKAWDFLFANQ